jgi:hypothetical protein
MPAKKMIILTSLGVLFLGGVAWLFVTVPIFVIDLLPDFLPLSVFAFLLFLIGLLFLTLVAVSFIRSISPFYTWAIILLSAWLIVIYNLSPLAPAWSCWGKRLYVLTVKADQNCRTVCTDNDKKPCGGWSSCWDKHVSCSSAGIDQGGRPCQGCCFACDVICEDDDPPPSPPVVSGDVTCSQVGNNGWCTGISALNLAASDPQGYSLTISGTINGSAFTCAAGNTCSLSLPEGNGPITFQATAATSGLSSSPGSAVWKRDITVPVVNAVYPAVNGSNGWHITSPVSVSASGSDTISGLANAQIAVNGGGWQSNASLADGVYVVDFLAVDNAGNSATTSVTIQVDATPPTVNPLVPSPDGRDDWFVTAPVNVSVEGADSMSGLASALVSVNGEAWQPNASLADGVYTINFSSIDNAGNTATETRTVKVDTVKPASQFTSPANSSTDTLVRGMYSLSGSSSDATSGISTAEISLDGKNWLPLVVSSDTWSYDWDTLSWSDGVYPVMVRAIDVAGNQELAVSGAHATLLVNNTPPHIKLTPEWLIWESGSLSIKTDYFPVRDGTIVIFDKQKRWPEVRIPFEEKYPAEITWDRRFANGILAPSGNYRVTVSACNIYDLCAEKSAVIKIPEVAAATLHTSPVPTEMVQVEQANPETKEAPSILKPPAAPTAVVLSPVSKLQVQGRAGSIPARSLLSFMVLVALMWAISSAALADKRPSAIHAIAKTIILYKHKGEFEHE